MNKGKTLSMVARMMENAGGLRYGSVSVTATIHDGRVVQISYTTNEHSRDQLSEKDEE